MATKDRAAASFYFSPYNSNYMALKEGYILALQNDAFYIIDTTDATKRVAFAVSGLTTATDRTVTVPDVSGMLGVRQMARADAARNLNDDNSAQAIFPTTHDALTVIAGQQYRFRVNGQVTKGVNNVSLSFLFGGTATFTTCVYNCVSTAAAAGTAAAANMIDAVAATAVAIQAATTAVNVRFVIEGEFEVNAAGTVIPQVQFSGATGSTPVVKVGTFIEVFALGANPVTGIGAFA